MGQVRHSHWQSADDSIDEGKLESVLERPSASWSNGMISSRLMSRRKTSGDSGSRSDEELVG